MTIAAERAVLGITRPWLAEWDEFSVPELRGALRATALARAAALRGAYRDLDPLTVPGIAECAALNAALGCERARGRVAADAIVARVLRSAQAAEPERGAELAHALALEWMVPLAIQEGGDATPADLIRFGRADEWFEVGGRERIPMRGRVGLFAGRRAVAVPGVVPGGDVHSRSRGMLRIVAFGPPTAAERFARHGAAILARSLRAAPDRSGFAFAVEATPLDYDV